MAIFIEKLNEDIKQAMRDKRNEDLSLLRMLLSALKNKKIELGNKQELNEEEVLTVIKSEVKKRKDSARVYQEGKREDLASKELAEIEILNKYLPEQMNEAEIEKIIKEIVENVENANLTNFGQIMKETMLKIKGRADGQVVSGLVKKILA